MKIRNNYSGQTSEIKIIFVKTTLTLLLMLAVASCSKEGGFFTTKKSADFSTPGGGSAAQPGGDKADQGDKNDDPKKDAPPNGSGSHGDDDGKHDGKDDGKDDEKHQGGGCHGKEQDHDEKKSEKHLGKNHLDHWNNFEHHPFCSIEKVLISDIKKNDTLLEKYRCEKNNLLPLCVMNKWEKNHLSKNRMRLIFVKQSGIEKISHSKQDFILKCSQLPEWSKIVNFMQHPQRDELCHCLHK